MKKITITVTIIITFAASIISQTDSTIYINDVDFSLYKTQKVKDLNTGKTILEKQITDIEDVTSLTFLKNDSLILLIYSDSPVYTRLSNISEVKKYKFRLSPVLGITIGAVGCGIIGGLIGSATSGNGQRQSNDFFGLNNAFAKMNGGFIGAIIGIIGGGIIGATITYSINHPTLELFSVPAKDKKSKLIKFLNHK
jgi:hypothetical protein